MKGRWSCFEKPKFLEDCNRACKRPLIEKMTTTGTTTTTTTTRSATFCKRQQLANLLIHFCQSLQECSLFARRYQLRCLLKENKTSSPLMLKNLIPRPLKMLISFPFKTRTAALIKVKDLSSFHTEIVYLFNKIAPTCFETWKCNCQQFNLMILFRFFYRNKCCNSN